MILYSRKSYIGESLQEPELEPSKPVISEKLSKFDFPEITELFPYHENVYKDDARILFIGQDGEIYQKILHEDIPELIADEKLVRSHKYDQEHAILLFTNGNLYNYNLYSQEKTLIESNIRDFRFYGSTLMYYIKDANSKDGTKVVDLSDDDEEISDNMEQSSDKVYEKIYNKAKSFTDKLEGIECPDLVCKYDGWYYFSVNPYPRGGSGEIYGWSASGTYFGVNHDGTKIKKFDDFRAEYIGKEDDWLYYVDLTTAEQYDYPGRGKIYRMRPDGTNRTELTSDIIYGGYHWHQDYFIYRVEDIGMVRLKKDGSERKVICRFELNYLNFFGDWIIGDLLSPPYDKKCLLKVDGSHMSKIPDDLDEENVLNWNDESFFFLTDDKRLLIYNKQ